MKKVLITGVSGFAGGFLAEHLIENKSYDVFGTYLSDSSLQKLSSIKDKGTFMKVDLVDRESVRHVIKTVKPDIIFHLAALSSPAESFKDPAQTFYNNVSGEINILESIRETDRNDTKILIISSAEVYGNVAPENLPIDEDTPLRPLTPYAVSKIAQDFLGLQYFLTYESKIIRVRPFNHIGPRQAPSFVVSAFAKQIAEIEKNICSPVIKVGNLETKRDFTDVRDIVKAYSSVIEKGKFGEVYNIGSGVSYKISTILEKMLSFSTTKITIEQDESRFRPGDMPEIVCDNRKIVTVTGWKPAISLDQSLKDTLNYWRNIV